MGAGSGVALKFLQWFVRGIQFCCAALVLAVYSYFLATLHNHNLPIGSSIRAVEGISGVGVLYTALGLLLLCCLAGHPFTSFFAIVLDVAFVGGFIYIATANRDGASSCSGQVSTPFGTGNAETSQVDNGSDGFTVVPSLHTACKLQTACLAVSIIAIFFFIFSALIEVALARHRHKEKRFGPSPGNNYTSGYPKKRGFMGLFGRGKTGTGLSEDPNVLPQHTHPNEVRDSYATEQTRVGTATEPAAATYSKYGDAGYDSNPGYTTHNNAYTHADTHHVSGVNSGAVDGVPTEVAHFPPGNYRYDDGVYDSRT